MKKTILTVLLLACVALGSAMAEDAAPGSGTLHPDYFSFNVGGMAYYSIGGNSVAALAPFGLQFYFNDMFSAGFGFMKYGTSTFLNVTVTPIKNAHIAFFTGQMDSQLAFGVGIGYDFLVMKKMLFSSLGIYFDWLASNAAAGAADESIHDGGLLCIGLKARFGL